MTVHYTDDSVTLHHGDCLDVLRQLPDKSVDAVVTDPPYGLEFMGKDWDAPWKAAGAVLAHATERGGFQDGPNGGNPYSRSRVEYGRGGDASVGFQQWCEQWTTECLRVLKPGGHLLAFGGTRTWHRLACAVEDAGFEVRDSIAWLYGSGFPKSLDVSKAIDKSDANDERRARALRFTAWMRSTGITSAQINEATGTNMGGHYLTDAQQPAVAVAELFDLLRPLLPEVPDDIEELVAQRTVESENYKRRQVVGRAHMVDTTRSRLGFAGETYGGDGSTREVDLTEAHTEEARQWQGWGTALKPAFEPIVVGRKPLAGTVAANVLAHATGALNIDGCRTQAGQDYADKCASVVGLGSNHNGDAYGEWTGVREDSASALGRWPANVVLDDSQAAELDRQSGTSRDGFCPAGAASIYGTELTDRDRTTVGYGGEGGASRFFPRFALSDQDRAWQAAVDQLPTFRYEAKAPTVERPRDGDVAHPTVKPLDLMRWLVRLVTPPGGTVLEPFAGSGTTAEACVIEGFQCIAIEREPTYLPLIVARLSKPIALDLFGGVA